MVKSTAKTPEEYLQELPEPRRKVISAVRDVILDNLPVGYEESMNWGMLSYEVPLSRYPDTYNGQPLSYAALAAQKNHFGLYAMCIYGSPEREAWVRESFKTAGKKLDMGKSCIRFKKLEDLPLDVVAEMIAGTSVDQFISIYEKSRG